VREKVESVTPIEKGRSEKLLQIKWGLLIALSPSHPFFGCVYFHLVQNDVRGEVRRKSGGRSLSIDLMLFVTHKESCCYGKWIIYFDIYRHFPELVSDRISIVTENFDFLIRACNTCEAHKNFM
jgi:hypothetical protein